MIESNKRRHLPGARPPQRSVEMAHAVPYEATLLEPYSKEQAARLRTARVEAIMTPATATIITNAEGIIIYAFGNTLTLFGLTDSDLKGQHYLDLCAKPKHKVTQRSDDLSSHGTEVMVSVGHGVINAMMVGSEYAAIDVQQFMVNLGGGFTQRIFRDDRSVGERLHHQRELLEKGYSALFHDFRNQLAVFGYLQMIESMGFYDVIEDLLSLLDNTKENTVTKDFVRTCMDHIQTTAAGAEQARVLFHELTEFLGIARKIGKPPVLLDLNALLGRIVDETNELAVKYGATITIENNVSGGDIYTYVGALAQAVRNLLSNAIKYGEGENSKPAEITIATSIRGETLYVSVEDKGLGLTKDQVQGLFDESSRTETNETGWGLGLILIKKVIEEVLGGTLEVQSQPGNTIFTIAIPTKEITNVDQISSRRIDKKQMQISSIIYQAQAYLRLLISEHGINLHLGDMVGLIESYELLIEFCTVNLMNHAISDAVESLKETKDADSPCSLGVTTVIDSDNNLWVLIHNEKPGGVVSSPIAFLPPSQIQAKNDGLPTMSFGDVSARMKKEFGGGMFIADAGGLGKVYALQIPLQTNQEEEVRLH